MGHPATVIPEKIFFKIGEVCDLVGVQAHVLRYWETEFPMFSPQKNRSGQRTYRRRDVEIALRIKELLYDELFTIAGAKKKLQIELRESSRLKIVHPEPVAARETLYQPVHAPVEPENDFQQAPGESVFDKPEINQRIEEPHEFGYERREAIRTLAAQLLELREMVKISKAEDENFHLRKY